jgi:4-amino-4-deoxy-L-arabinose transferase-like glycosyltransferase
MNRPASVPGPSEIEMLESMRKLFATHRLEIAIIAAIGFLALSAYMSDAPLIDWDEATYAEVAHEAVQNHDYLNLTWNGDRYLKKPPMLFWMIALSFNTFRESEIAARVPSMLLGTLTMVLLYFAASAAAGRGAGILAAILPLGFYFFIARGGREAATDAPLLFFMTLSVLAISRARAYRAWMILAGAACGFAILSKGLAGAIPAIVAIGAVAMIPAYREIGVPGLAIFFACAAIAAAPWYGYAAVENQSAFWSVFVGQETLARVTSHLEDHQRDLGFTIDTLYREVGWLWPVLISAMVLAIDSLRAGLRAALKRIPPDAAVWTLWLAIAFAAACAVQTRLPWYILPALMPIALLAGSAIGAALSAAGPARTLSQYAAVTSLVIIAAMAPARWERINAGFRLQRERSIPSYMMAMRARNLARARLGGELYFAGISLPTMVYYSGLKCHFVAPAPSAGVELISDESGSPRVGLHDLVLVDPDGAAFVVSNYDREWRISVTGEAPAGPHRHRHISRLPPDAIAERKIFD